MNHRRSLEATALEHEPDDRRDDEDADSNDQGLTALEPLIRQAIRAHWRHVEPRGRSTRLDDLMETAFGSFCKDRLTYQQRRIVQLILRGHSNLSIGEIISVTEGTVKIHRQNIYKRLNISSQQELFALFVESILSS